MLEKVLEVLSQILGIVASLLTIRSFWPTKEIKVEPTLPNQETQSKLPYVSEKTVKSHKWLTIFITFGFASWIVLTGFKYPIAILVGCIVLSICEIMFQFRRAHLRYSVRNPSNMTNFVHFIASFALLLCPVMIYIKLSSFYAAADWILQIKQMVLEGGFSALLSSVLTIDTLRASLILAGIESFLIAVFHHNICTQNIKEEIIGKQDVCLVLLLALFSALIIGLSDIVPI